MLRRVFLSFRQIQWQHRNTKSSLHENHQKQESGHYSNLIKYYYRLIKNPRRLPLLRSKQSLYKRKCVLFVKAKPEPKTLVRESVCFVVYFRERKLKQGIPVS